MMENMPEDDRNTPIWKRVLALVGVAAVLGFVLWLVANMLTFGG